MNIKDIDPATRQRLLEEARRRIDPEARRLNEEVFKLINQQARADPSSPYAGKHVGLVNGEVVVSDDVRVAMARLRELDPGLGRSRVFEASRDYTVVERV
ncbi:MAG: hypothetical protein K2W96_22410 [Gemmataceae bacterium]|nr:hypothetical protein [Gemmataceae bacterium]